MTSNRSKSSKTFFCSACSVEELSPSPTSGYGKPLLFRKAIKTISKQLLVPPCEIVDNIIVTTESFCRKCFNIVEEIIDFQIKIEALELQIRYQVDLLGTTIKSTPKPIFDKRRGTVVGRSLEVFEKFTQPVLNNFFEGLLPNHYPSVSLKRSFESNSSRTNISENEREMANKIKEFVLHGPTLSELWTLERREIKQELFADADENHSENEEATGGCVIQIDIDMPILSKQCTPTAQKVDKRAYSADRKSSERDNNDMNISNSNMPDLFSVGFEVAPYLLDALEGHGSESYELEDIDDDLQAAIQSWDLNRQLELENYIESSQSLNGDSEDNLMSNIVVKSIRSLAVDESENENEVLNVQTPDTENSQSESAMLLENFDTARVKEENVNLRKLKKPQKPVLPAVENVDVIESLRRVQPCRAAAPKTFNFSRRMKHSTTVQNPSTVHEVQTQSQKPASHLFEGDTRVSVKAESDISPPREIVHLFEGDPRVSVKAESDISPLREIFYYFKCHKCDFTTEKIPSNNKSNTKLKNTLYKMLDDHYSSVHNPVKLEEISKTLDNLDCYKCSSCDFVSKIGYDAVRSSTSFKSKQLNSAHLKLSKHYRKKHEIHVGKILNYTPPPRTGVTQSLKTDENEPKNFRVCTKIENETDTYSTTILNTLFSESTVSNRKRDSNQETIPLLPIINRKAPYRKMNSLRMRMVLNKDGNDCFQCPECYFRTEINYSDKKCPYVCREDAYKSVYEHFNTVHSSLRVQALISDPKTINLVESKGKSQTQSVKIEENPKLTKAVKQLDKLTCPKCDYLVSVKSDNRFKGHTKQMKRCQEIAEGKLTRHILKVHKGEVSQELSGPEAKFDLKRTVRPVNFFQAGLSSGTNRPSKRRLPTSLDIKSWNSNSLVPNMQNDLVDVGTLVAWLVPTIGTYRPSN